ncbi:MAG: protein-glutamate O-methyltransferase CheR [Spirochaetes bacterium]|nr:protein-glutamate O-methyltransferase CheR [Spirochaetota bacterium]
MALTLTDEYFEKFKTTVYEESGICFNSVNRVVLEARINENIKRKSLAGFDAYYQLVKSNKEELREFLDSITTNLTKFFRNESQFVSLRQVLPQIAAKKTAGNRVIRIWSAGCSTGEEPYSIAITAGELGGALSGCTVSIFASDISLKSLITAKEGRYRKDRFENVDKAIVERYFDVMPEECVARDNIKKMITFDYHNLKHPVTFKDLDIIFCRNVIIYFDAESQKRTIDRFYEALGPAGYLYLGHSESLFGMTTNFKFNKLDDAIVYTKGI